MIYLNFPKILIGFFILFIPFSHAPSVIGPYFTFPFIASILIITLYIFKVFFQEKKINFYDYTIFVLFFIFFAYMVFNFLLNSSVNKSLSYLVAYTWFTFFVCASYYCREYLKDFNSIWLKFIIIGVVISVFYNFSEIVLNLKGDGFSYLPRYDRTEYRFFSPLGFRVRGFNYESSNYALYVSVIFSFLFFKIKDYIRQLFLIFIWFFLLLLSFSSFHLFLFIFFILPVLTIYGHKRLKYIFSGLFTLLIILLIYFYSDILVDVYKIIYLKLSSYLMGQGLESGEVRNQLVKSGVNQISNYPLFGQGLASFYLYQDTGYNNIYIQTFQQLGFFGGCLFLFLIFFPLMSKVKVYRKIPLCISLASLWFIGDFWLPQIFFSYMVLHDEI